MENKLIDLSPEQIEVIENKLEAFDENYTKPSAQGRISIGIERDGRLIAGLDAQMTTFNILYLSELFVEADFRGRGLGRKLMEEMEKRAKEMGANTIRLDTFDWQGAQFYPKLDYVQVGFYENELDGYSEHFFVKRI